MITNCLLWCQEFTLKKLTYGNSKKNYKNHNIKLSKATRAVLTYCWAWKKIFQKKSSNHIIYLAATMFFRPLQNLQSVSVCRTSLGFVCPVPTPHPFCTSPLFRVKEGLPSPISPWWLFFLKSPKGLIPVLYGWSVGGKRIVDWLTDVV